MIQIRRFKLLPLLLVLLLIFLQYRLWFESGGVLDMMKLKKENEVQIQENEKQKKRNEKLFIDVQHLQKDKGAIESRARAELGMIKKGETFYQVVK